MTTLPRRYQSPGTPSPRPDRIRSHSSSRSSSRSSSHSDSRSNSRAAKSGRFARSRSPPNFLARKSRRTHSHSRSGTPSPERSVSLKTKEKLLGETNADICRLMHKLGINTFNQEDLPKPPPPYLFESVIKYLKVVAFPHVRDTKHAEKQQLLKLLHDRRILFSEEFLDLGDACWPFEILKAASEGFFAGQKKTNNRRKTGCKTRHKNRPKRGCKTGHNTGHKNRRNSKHRIQKI